MKRAQQLMVLICSLFLCHFALAASALTPVGSWKTIDDVTGQPKAIIHIWETPNGVLYGRILRIFPSHGKDQNELCTACQGAKHNQRMVGMVILNGLTQDQENMSKWSGGEILDPKNGKTYHCTIEVVDGGRKLNVRGYVGVSLFGRTQTWLRE